MCVTEDESQQVTLPSLPLCVSGFPGLSGAWLARLPRRVQLSPARDLSLPRRLRLSLLARRRRGTVVEKRKPARR